MALMVCAVVDNTGHSSYLSISTRFTGQLLLSGDTEGVSALLHPLIPYLSTGWKHDSAAVGVASGHGLLLFLIQAGLLFTLMLVKAFMPELHASRRQRAT